MCVCVCVFKTEGERFYKRIMYGNSRMVIHKNQND